MKTLPDLRARLSSLRQRIALLRADRDAITRQLDALGVEALLVECAVLVAEREEARSVEWRDSVDDRNATGDEVAYG